MLKHFYHVLIQKTYIVCVCVCVHTPTNYSWTCKENNIIKQFETIVKNPDFRINAITGSMFSIDVRIVDKRFKKKGSSFKSRLTWEKVCET